MNMINRLGLNAYNNPYWAVRATPQTFARSPVIPNPLYDIAGKMLQQTRNQLTSTLKDVRSSFTKLYKEADSLTAAKSGNVFDKRKVDVGGTGALSATAADKAALASYTFNISQIAKAKETTGDPLNRDDATTVAAGTNTFHITVDGNTKTVSVHVSAADTNRTVLSKMADAINNADAGVTAKVVDETVSGAAKSRIVVTAKETGTEKAFTLTPGTGDLLAKTNAANETVAAQNAIYSLNGGSAVESQSNQVSLDNGKVVVTLKEAAAADITLKVDVQRDAKSAVDQFAKFAEQYNETLGLLKEKAGVINKNLVKDLTRYAKEKMGDLAEAGVTINADNTLTVDKAKLEKALTENHEKTKELLGGTVGLATEAGNKAKALTESPAIRLLNNTSPNWMRESWNRIYQQQTQPYMGYNMGAQSSRLYGAGNLFNLFL